MDPDLSKIRIKVRKNFDFYHFVTFLDFLSMKIDVNIPSKGNKQKPLEKTTYFLLASCHPLTKKALIRSRIRKSMVRIFGSGSIPKRHGSITLKVAIKMTNIITGCLFTESPGAPYEKCVCRHNVMDKAWFGSGSAETPDCLKDLKQARLKFFSFFSMYRILCIMYILCRQGWLDAIYVKCYSTRCLNFFF